MGRFTPVELARMAPGRSPEELARMDMDPAEFERMGAKLHAAHAETTHKLDMQKVAGLYGLAQIKHDPEVLAAARVLHNQAPAGPSVDDLIEAVVIPIREKYVESFSGTTTPSAPHKAGANEQAFDRIMGGGDEGS